MLAFIGALLLGVSVIYLRDILFDRYRSRDEVARDLGIPLFGEIPKGRDAPTLESFRSLRAAVSMALEHTGSGINGPSKAPEGGRSVLITGAESGCGKSYVAAISPGLAAEGRRVVAIDADLRRPTLHDHLRRAPLTGSATCCSTRAPRMSPASPELTATSVTPRPANCAWSQPAPTLKRRSSGSPPSGWRPSVDLLPPKRRRLRQSRRRLRSSTPSSCSRYADGVLFVVDSRKTKRRDARRSIEALRAMGVPLLGFVYNRSETRKSRYDAYRPHEPRRTPPMPRESRT